MIANSLDETKQIASDFASALKGGDIVFLEGDLGAGKTTFVQGVLESLGYLEPVRSPTFSIMNVYAIENHPKIHRVIHLDFYRFNSTSEIHSLGLDEFLEDPKTVLLIEWPEKGIEDASLIFATKRVHLRAIDEQTREIEIK